MKDFDKMTFTEINNEMARFQEQILRQQADGIPLTQRQMNYYYALSKAFRRINAEVAK